MNSNRFFPLLLTLFILFPIHLFGIEDQFIVREIPPVEMEMNQSITLSLSPYLLNLKKNSELDVRVLATGGDAVALSSFPSGTEPSGRTGRAKTISAIYNAKKNSLTITPQQNWFGLGHLNLKISRSSIAQTKTAGKKNVFAELTLLVKVIKKPKTTFRYKPNSAVQEAKHSRPLGQKVYLAGDFNGWNSNANRMNGPDKEGGYFLALPLSGGRYNYKFVVDDKWLSDPKNPNKIPDGYGGYNSVLDVLLYEPPQLFGIEKNAGWDPSKALGDIHAVIGFEAGKSKDSASINPDSIAILSNGKWVSAQSYEWSESSRTIALTLKNLPADQYLIRVVAADRKGNITNEISFNESLGGAPGSFDWHDAIIYSIVTDRFFNGDKSNDNPIKDERVPSALNYQGGDWEGIIQKIKSGYFNELGVNALWISPVNDNPQAAFPKGAASARAGTGYHGYWPISWTDPEEHFGTMAKLKELVSTAHANGIKIILDAVLNHLHEDHPFYKQKPKWFSPLTLPDGRKNIQLFDERPLDTWFAEFLPDIDYENNPDAVQRVVENTLWWIDQTGADGLRLDAVKHMPHSFWKSLRAAINESIELPQKKIFYLVGETISSRDLIRKFMGDDELHGQFDFPLYWTIRDVFAWGTSDFERLELERMKSEAGYGRNLVASILGNHDFPRFMTYADGELTPENDGKSKEIGWTNPPTLNHPLSYRKLKLAFTFLLTQPEIPTIYYGDEIGLPGAGDPDNRRMMRFEPDLNENERDSSNFVKKIISIRKRNPALRMGRHRNIMVQKDIYLYQKEFFGNRVVVGLNKGKSSAIIEFGLPGVRRWRNLLDESVILSDEKGTVRFELKAYEAAIFSPV